MEKFINIAKSINNLIVYNAYKIARIDIQLVDHEFHAFLTLQGNEGNSTIDIHIYPDCSFEEVL